jgi:hypothetical protein
MIQRARDSRLAEKHTQELETAKRELKLLTGRARRGLEEAIEDDHSSWLSAVPLEHLALDLNRQVFRDAVALKMGQDLPDPLPQYCPDCGEDFDISHALTCKKGAWIVRRHHEVKAAWRALFREVSDQVDDEPVLPPAVMAAITKKSTTTDPGARGDIRVRGLFQVQQDAYTDVVVVDTGCPSNVGKGAMTVLRAAETRKHSMYDERVRRKPLPPWPALYTARLARRPPKFWLLSQRVLTLNVRRRRTKSQCIALISRLPPSRLCR